ncbi:MAG: transposase [Polyangiaceae bacterium]
MPHRQRKPHVARHPVHVTMRAGIRSLRSQFMFPTVCIALAQANRKAPSEFRICEFSVQADHIHLIVEATSNTTLVKGMRGLSIRLARALNRLVFRRGQVIVDRWHSRDLTSPREVRHALVYVLGNFKKHEGVQRVGLLDPCSSAPCFTGYGDAPAASRAPPASSIVLLARTWLLREGWRRRGLLSIREAPRG